MFDFKILFAIIFIIISDEIFQLSHVIFIIQFKIQDVNQVFSQIHVRVAYLFLYLHVARDTMLSSCECEPNGQACATPPTKEIRLP
jgi:hypothetical protein